MLRNKRRTLIGNINIIWNSIIRLLFPIFIRSFVISYVIVGIYNLCAACFQSLFCFFRIIFIYHFINLAQKLTLLVIIINFWLLTLQQKCISLLFGKENALHILHNNYLITFDHNILLGLLNDSLLLVLNLIARVDFGEIETTEILQETIILLISQRQILSLRQLHLKLKKANLSSTRTRTHLRNIAYRLRPSVIV